MNFLSLATFLTTYTLGAHAAMSNGHTNEYLCSAVLWGILSIHRYVLVIPDAPLLLAWVLPVNCYLMYVRGS
jgi:hypothetical protein